MDYYAVGSTAERLAGGDATHFFVTSPPRGTAAPARIWVLGDSGTADLNAQTVRDAFYGFNGSAFANLWLMLGDNADNDAGLTWTLVRRANTQAGSAEVWQAKAAARLVNVTVKSTQTKATFRQSLTVVSFRGASGVGASAIASAATGAPSASLLTTKPNALVYGVGNDPDRAVGRTLGTGQTMVHQSVVTASGDTFWVQRRSAAAATAGSSVAVNCTAPCNDHWNLVAVEIVP